MWWWYNLGEREREQFSLSEWEKGIRSAHLIIIAAAINDPCSHSSSFSLSANPQIYYGEQRDRVIATDWS